MNTQSILPFFLLCSVITLSCSQDKQSLLPERIVEKEVPEPVTVQAEQAVREHHKKMHPYGGWSCPDNLSTFPPVDVKEVAELKVVQNRLPRKDEIERGESLMYFDTKEIPSARPMDIELPQLARYYSKYTEKNELIVVIQAVIAESDTVLGFRYLNGGNGSAWYDEVEFIEDEEWAQMESTPFIFYEDYIRADLGDIWKVITDSAYTELTGGLFNKEAFQVPDHKKDSEVYYQFAPESSTPRGYITAFWDQLYIQVDYNFDGRHYAQKILLLPQQGNAGVKVQVVSGPHGDDYMDQQDVWSGWFRKVKELSEAGVKM